jgi:hypothetical protein
MKHIITDEEVERFRSLIEGSQGDFGRDVQAALIGFLADFLNNRPESTLGKLRPIAEMPDTVPEGCVRMFVYRHASGCFGGPFFIHSTGERFNFFADIQLPAPDPEAEERRQVEEWAKPKNWNLTFNDGCYTLAWVDFAFQAYKEGKTAKAIK